MSKYLDTTFEGYWKAALKLEGGLFCISGVSWQFPGLEISKLGPEMSFCYKRTIQSRNLCHLESKNFNEGGVGVDMLNKRIEIWYKTPYALASINWFGCFELNSNFFYDGAPYC